MHDAIRFYPTTENCFFILPGSPWHRATPIQNSRKRVISSTQKNRP
jgi:hypothetical protein